MTFGSSWVMVCIDGLGLSARRACPPTAAGSRRGLTGTEPTELHWVWEAATRVPLNAAPTTIVCPGTRPGPSGAAFGSTMCSPSCVLPAGRRPGAATDRLRQLPSTPRSLAEAAARCPTIDVQGVVLDPVDLGVECESHAGFHSQ